MPDILSVGVKQCRCRVVSKSGRKVFGNVRDGQEVTGVRECQEMSGGVLPISKGTNRFRVPL